MAVGTIAILSPGSMGSAVGKVLRESGYDLVTNLDGRSERTRALAEEAGFRAVSGIDSIVEEADLVMSILVPSEAISVAGEAAAAMKRTGASPAYADCNAVSPDTARELGGIIEAAGGRFIDAGIIGGPPGSGSPPRFYASGPHEAVIGELDGKGIIVPLLGGDVGRASAIKMCYASLTKGVSALQTAALVAAYRLGLSSELEEEMSSSQANVLAQMQSVIGLPGKAFRWVGEMEEIAATFESVGVTGNFHHGAAEIFRMVAGSPLGDERPETIDPNRTLQETVEVFAAGGVMGVSVD